MIQHNAAINIEQVKFELGDLLVAYLQQLSVEYVFGVPGGAIEPLYNALARNSRRNDLRAITARHETGAVFMADGYARQTGKIGVCCATTGPGTTNLITGVASAYENQIPLLVITAQTAIDRFGRGAIQESSCTGTNTVGMLQFCTRYNSLVSHAQQLEHKLVTAILTAHQSPNGPVHLSIPLDILRSPALVEKPSYDLAAQLRPFSPIDSAATGEFFRTISQARKVIFVIGENCGAAIGTILQLANIINAVIMTTPQGKGLVSPYHPLFAGVLGFAGHDNAKAALHNPETDVIVAIGTKLSEWVTGGNDSCALLNERLVHIDSTAEHFTYSPMAGLHIKGCLNAIFADLLQRMLKERNDQLRIDNGALEQINHVRINNRNKLGFRLHEEFKCHTDVVPIKPQRLMQVLSEIFPASTCYLVDAGNSYAWAIHYLHPLDRRCSGPRPMDGGFLRSAMEFATMGWAIGAAVGTALAKPGRPVVCICGDGSLLMNGQEMTVAVQEHLPVIFIVLNDAELGMVKHGQRLANSEAIGFKLPHVDFAAYASAMGAVGHTIRSSQDLLSLNIETICHRAGPTLIDVQIDAEEVPPMQMRTRVLSTVK